MAFCKRSGSEEYEDAKFLDDKNKNDNEPRNPQKPSIINAMQRQTFSTISYFQA